MGRKLTLVLVVTAALLMAMAAPGLGHVTANPDESTGGYFKTDLRVSHGCDGEPTTEVRVQVPDGVSGVRPQPVLDWDIELEEDNGEVTEVVWTGNELPDDYVEEFGLNMSIEEDADEVLYFPTIQTCTDSEHAWVEIPDSVDEWGALDEPAPYVQLVADEGPQDTDEAEGADAEDAGNDEEAAADEGDQVAAADPAGATEDAGTDPLVYVALVVAVLGLATGLGAIAQARRH